MRISDLTSNQLRNVKIFNLLLEYAGWEDIEEVEKRLMLGEALDSIGQRLMWTTGFVLEARMHAYLNCMMLDVLEVESGKQAEIQLFFQDKPDRILEWLMAEASSMNLQNYAQLLAAIAPACERILVEAESLVYEIHLS